MSLPAGAMISLTTALEGVYTLWPREGKPRKVPAIDFVTGNHKNVLRAGRAVAQHPSSRERARRSASPSAATRSPISGGPPRSSSAPSSKSGDDLMLTITAATPKPMQLHFDRHAVGRARCATRSKAQFRTTDWFDDVHGSAPYKRHLTYYYAEQIRAELAAA